MNEVVLVDDDVIVIEFLKKVIPWHDYGFQVVASFQDSSEALAFMEENPFDVLITDIGMPKLNGIELIEQLKKLKINSYNVILSCHDEFTFAQQAIKLEAYDYILKESMEETNIIALLERLKEKLDQEGYTSYQHIKVSKLLELTSRNEDVLKAQEYVKTHLGEKISLTEVAAHLHLNSSYLSRMYKKETGEGFVEYVTRVKMEKALELLDQSFKSVEQIAYELGFDSKSYFLKTFKRFYGVSPKSFKHKDNVSV
ncbi:two-component system response regulator YesN [Bacillus niacini]|uniref:Two-component system response regulator YesN n=1 Tax=Neobacillus niacini TaxID=86668 RepID=A0A852TLZ9_9BACI|nr:response regulator [Neobacillus niacini]NYE09181.1 two-component system response regulator YesN [Neobacillus niacini]